VADSDVDADSDFDSAVGRAWTTSERKANALNKDAAIAADFAFAQFEGLVFMRSIAKQVHR
jgi:hypothetical protein